jgi:putative DNA primase/helicase
MRLPFDPEITPDADTRELNSAPTGILESAYKYLDLGFSIIPVGLGDKKPIEKWDQFQHRRPTREEVCSWFSCQARNIGIVCGKASNGLVILDFDDLESYRRFYPDSARLERETIVVRTGRGVHVWFRSKTSVRSFNIPELNLNVIAEGKFAVAPPSRHPTGATYEFVNGMRQPAEIDFPDSIRKRCEELGVPIPTIASTDTTLLNAQTHAEVRPWRRLPAEMQSYFMGVHEGEREVKAFKLACLMINEWKFPPETALQWLISWNAMNTPPLESYELQHALESTVRGYIFGNEVLQTGREAADDELKRRGPPILVLSSPSKYFDGNGRFVAKRLADELLATSQVKTLRDTKEIYLYEEGIWSPKGESRIHAECQKRLGERASTYNVNEVLNYMRGETYVEREMFNAHVNLVNLENGVYDLQNGELLPHNPMYMFTNRLPLIYDPDATCPRIEQFLMEIQPDEISRRGMVELIGYCLYRSYLIAIAWMLVGNGANGKSTFINLIKKFLASSNTVSISLHDLEENRFAKAALYGKHANLYPDLPNRALYQTGTFKMLTGGDPLTAEKKFRDQFNFVNYAKMVFSTNQVPRAPTDDSDAFHRRWIIINFLVRFEGDAADPKILDRLTTQEEMSGLLNLALKALKELLSRGQFINDKNTDSKREQYIRLSDPVRTFVMDCVDASHEDFVSKDEVYQTFCNYCRSHNYPSLAKVTFDKRFRSEASVQDYRPEVGGTRVHAWKGIKLRSDDDIAKDGQAKLQ